MNKQQMLNGMSEEEFYRLYPTKAHWERAHKMKLGGLSGAPHNGQPTADQFFSYGSHANDKLNIPMSNPFYLAYGGTPYYGGPLYPAVEGVAMPAPAAGKPLSEADYKRLQQAQNILYQSGANKGYKENWQHPQFTQATQDYYSLTGKHPEAVKGQYAQDLQQDPYKKMTYHAEFAKPQQTAYQDYLKGFQKPSAPAAPAAAPVPPKQQPITPAAQQLTGTQAPAQPATANPYKATWDFNSGQTKVYRDKAGKIVATETYMGGKPYETTYGEPQGATTVKQGAFDVANLATPSSKYGGALGEYCWGGLPGGPNEIPAMLHGGYHSPMNYGSFPVTSEWGGILDASNINDYPKMDIGGLKKILGAAARKMKKAQGGDTTITGGNEDYLKNKNTAFQKSVGRLMNNAFIDQEYENISKAMMQVGGQPMQGPQLNTQNANYQSGLQNQMSGYQQRRNQDMGNFYNATLNFANNLSTAAEGKEVVPWYKALAAMYSPDQGAASNFYSPLNYIPANVSRKYEMSNKDLANIDEWGQKYMPTGYSIKSNYGKLAQLLGKFGRRAFGPKSVELTFRGEGKGLPSLKDKLQVKGVSTQPWNTPDKPVMDYMNDEDPGMGNFKYKRPVVSDNSLMQKAKDAGYSPFMVEAPEESWIGPGHPQSNKRYGGYLHKAQFGEANALGNVQSNTNMNPIAMPQVDYRQAAIDAKPDDAYTEPTIMKGEAAPTITDKVGNAPEVKGTIKRKYSGIGQAIGQYAIPTINALASVGEKKDFKNAQKKYKESLDPMNMFVANQGTQGDYSVNNPGIGPDFRPNQTVPVQYPGGMYQSAYGGSFQMGGFYEEGEEYDLTPEEIEELRAQGYELEQLD